LFNNAIRSRVRFWLLSQDIFDELLELGDMLRCLLFPDIASTWSEEEYLRPQDLGVQLVLGRDTVLILLPDRLKKRKELGEQKSESETLFGIKGSRVSKPCSKDPRYVFVVPDPTGG